MRRAVSRAAALVGVGDAVACDGNAAFAGLVGGEDEPNGFASVVARTDDLAFASDCREEVHDVLGVRRQRVRRWRVPSDVGLGPRAIPSTAIPMYKIE